MTHGMPRRYRTAAGTPRRRQRVRRASAGLSPTRAAAILAMLVAFGAAYGLVATSTFGYHQLDVRGAQLTTEDDVRGQLELPGGTNLVGLATDPIEARIRRLPAVADVEVSVGLPDELVVSLTERRAVVIWALGDRRYAVDADGFLFASIGGNATDATRSIPVVIDERTGSYPLGVGSTLGSVDLDAATRIASLTPVQIGSHASQLRVHITDDRGFTLSSGSGGWVAIFGYYGLTQRTPALIPGQVQLLTALLAGREDGVQTVILADDKEGTYVPRASVPPSSSPRP